MSSTVASDLARERAVALTVVARASRLAQSVFKKLVNQETVTKKDKSPVTVADYSCQSLISLLLSRAFPDDPLVGEEDAADLRGESAEATTLRTRVEELVNAELARPQEDGEADGLELGQKREVAQLLDAIDRGTFEGGAMGRMWCVDPIDGTKGFLRGEQYAVCLALLVGGDVHLGVIGCPNLPVDPANPQGERGVLFVATKNEGAFSRPLSSPTAPLLPIRFNPLTPSLLGQASFCESVEAGHSSQGDAAAIAAKLGITRPPVRMDSQAKYCSVSRGDGDVYLRLPVGKGYEEKIWDHAPGRLLVSEAGGKVTDLHGALLDFSLGRTLKNNQGVIVAHKDVHAEVLRAVQEVMLGK